MFRVVVPTASTVKFNVTSRPLPDAPGAGPLVVTPNIARPSVAVLIEGVVAGSG
jgi:hypothetical protein